MLLLITELQLCIYMNTSKPTKMDPLQAIILLLGAAFQFEPVHPQTTL